MLSSILLFATSVYIRTGLFLEWKVMLVLCTVNAARYCYIATVHLIGEAHWTSTKKYRLMLSFTNACISFAICSGSVGVTLSWSGSGMADQPELRWDACMLVLMTIGNIIFSALWLLSQCSAQDDALEAADMQGRRTRRLLYERRWQPRVVSSVLEEGAAECEGSCCAICLEDFSPGCTMGKLPCSHLYHSECITKWFRNQRVEARCPMRCRPTTSSSCQDTPRPAAVIGSEYHSAVDL
jgi:hypothetical protein